MTSPRRALIVPILLIAIGVGWLISTLGMAPGINWIWTLGLAAVGLLSFLISGVDKVSVVLAPFFIVTSCLSVLRQMGRLPLDVEVPILVIVAGVLLLVAQLPVIPLPRWLEQPSASERR